MGKLFNEYAACFPRYSETPKAVIAAVAYSMALMLCEHDRNAAMNMLAKEWGILFENGIVPQRPLAALAPAAPAGGKD